MRTLAQLTSLLDQFNLKTDFLIEILRLMVWHCEGGGSRAKQCRLR